MSLNHQFFLLKVEEQGQWHKNWFELIKTTQGIQLHEDVLRYIADTLQWIPTYNPATKQAHEGLCWYGMTWVQAEGASIMAKVLASWADLLSCGSAELELTGSYGYQVENDSSKDGFEVIAANSGRYEKLIFNRDELVTKLRTLSAYAKQFQEQGSAYYILHLGI